MFPMPLLKEIDGGDELALGSDRRILVGALDLAELIVAPSRPPEGLAEEARGPNILGIEVTPPDPLPREKVLGEGAATEGVERVIAGAGEGERPENDGAADLLGAEIRGEATRAVAEPEDRLMDRGAGAALRLI
ncbi:MAG: hypothetical protein KA354_17780 [Phycisphaerae bacterium]|nr:hypothetical protein [Phycisphaerae bacterium]